jgi:hypothetical protein
LDAEAAIKIVLMRPSAVMNTGLTEVQMMDIILVLEKDVGKMKSAIAD